MSDELARLAGGDQHDLAVDQIERLVLAAEKRLEEQFPFFYDKEYTIP